ncbi:MAG: PHP domain-containing protein [Chloroflexi bacterium]|nr:PHP domain-containing protein [Chloroflexota bacterium]
MLRGDFHMHTHFSYDCLTTPEALVKRCLLVGLNCIAVTDHNSLEGGRAAQRIAPFTVIVGAEVKSTAGEVTGLFLQEDVPAGLDPGETARRIKEQGALVSVPHPFTGMGRSALDRATATDLLPYIDIVEGFNARTMRASDNYEARRFAAEHGLPITAVSDAHTIRELGSTFTEFPEFDGTPEGFRQALTEAALTESPASAFVHVYTTLNKLVRRVRKPRS